MAIQVRLDITPQEFDLLRAALDTHCVERLAFADNKENDPAFRRIARADSLRTVDLRRKLNGG